MSIVRLTAPPALGPSARYTDYKDWLLSNFFEHLCSYCLLFHQALDVDHYEPRRYAELRIHDPHNLLLGCETCNGSSGKSDYHPNHVNRQRGRQEAHGYLVLDVRTDDFGKLYDLQDDGSLLARPGPEQTRAAWAAPFIKLDWRNGQRAQLLGVLYSAETALEDMLDERLTIAQRERESMKLAPLVRYLAPRLLFFRVFEVPISRRLFVLLAYTSAILRW